MLPRPHRVPEGNVREVQQLPGRSPKAAAEGAHDYGSPAANAAAQKLVRNQWLMDPGSSWEQIPL